MRTGTIEVVVDPAVMNPILPLDSEPSALSIFIFRPLAGIEDRLLAVTRIEENRSTSMVHLQSCLLSSYGSFWQL
jgi:hypothetical protein